jgi:sugar lactone lactonase YvrE
MKKIIVLVSIIFTIFLSNAQVVITLAGGGNFNNPPGVCLDASGNIFVADQLNYKIKKITPNGIVSTFAGSTQGYQDGTGASAKFGGPRHICIDTSGNFYVSDWVTHTIRKISPTGVVSTLAGNGSPGYVDGIGNTSQFNSPNGIAVDLLGNIYVADGQKIRKINTNGIVTTFAGSTQGYLDGNGINAKFSSPYGICVDATGNLFITEISNKIRKITPLGVVTTLATISGSTPNNITVDSNNNFYLTRYHDILKIDSSGIQSIIAGSSIEGNLDGAANISLFRTPNGISIDSQNNIYVADQLNAQIRKIIPCSSYITANITYGGSPFCKSLTVSQPVSLSGTGPYTGGSFSSTTGLTINSQTGAVNPNTSTAGTYTVTYSTPSVSGCPSVSTTTQVTITAIPTASINYSGSPFCKSLTTGQPVTLTGTVGYIGGIYSSSAGLSINASTGAINPSLSTAGTYTVTYSTPASGGCIVISTTSQVTIAAIPTASISYLGTPFCNSQTSSQSVTLTGTGNFTGGIYSSNPPGLTINANTGAITPSSSNVFRTYTVTYTTPASGACLVSTTTQVYINNLPTVSLSYPGSPYCNSLDYTTLEYPNLSSTGNIGAGTWSSSPAGLSITTNGNGAFYPSLSSPGTYTVTYTPSAYGGCLANPVSTQLIILSNQTASISADGNTSTNTTINSGNVVQLQLNGSLGTPANIQWFPNTNIGISSTSISNPLVYPTSTTTYYASFFNTNGCQQSTSITVNVTPRPNIGTISLSSTNTGTIGLFDTITVNVQLTNATDLYSLYMKLKGNAAVSQYLDYTTYTASNLLGTSNVISTPPTVTNGVPDFGMTKVGAAPGYSGSGLFYTFKFIPKNISIPDGTVFCFYLDDVNTYNSTATTCGLTNQGPICFTFTNQEKVWPGDLNKSNMVTTADLLPIGYFYNSTGPVRPNATIQWTGQPTILWGYNRATMNGSAYKTFADSNGDGVINNADQAAIGFNMNQIHARQANHKPFGIAPNTSNNAQVVGTLNVTPNNSIINGATLPQTVTFTVNLTNTGGLSSLYGISVNLIFDNTIFDLSTTTINYTGSIFGNVGTDCLVMNYNSATGVSVGLTRYANSAINGQGLLFKVTLQTRTTLPNFAQTQVTSYVDSANNQNGEILEISDSTPINFSVINNNLNINDNTSNNIKLYPNPAKEQITIDCGNDSNVIGGNYRILNTLGQEVQNGALYSQQNIIQLNNIKEQGIYFVKIYDCLNILMGTKKIIVKK